MKLLKRGEALIKTKNTTEECCKMFSEHPKPIKGDSKQNLFKLYSSAFGELALVENFNVSECSSIAQYLFVKVAENDRQKFLDILEKNLTIIEAYNNGVIHNLKTQIATDLFKAQTVKQVTDCVISELERSKTGNITKQTNNDKVKEL